MRLLVFCMLLIFPLLSTSMPTNDDDCPLKPNNSIFLNTTMEKCLQKVMNSFPDISRDHVIYGVNILTANSDNISTDYELTDDEKVAAIIVHGCSAYEISKVEPKFFLIYYNCYITTLERNLDNVEDCVTDKLREFPACKYLFNKDRRSISSGKVDHFFLASLPLYVGT
ncbi:hypothetical protein CHUAL_008789 [Chamberlinius hualienensis]